MEPLPVKDNDSYHLEEVDELGLMTDLILSSQGGEKEDPDAVSVYEFDSMYGIVWEMEAQIMHRNGLSSFICSLS